MARQTKTESMMAARCELALMGKVVNCTNEEAQWMLNYICKVVELPKVDIMERINRYGHNDVRHIVVNTIEDMIVVSFLLEGEGYPAPFATDYECGYPCSFCYVCNLSYPDYSEFGDCFFHKKADGFYHRVS